MLLTGPAVVCAVRMQGADYWGKSGGYGRSLKKLWLQLLVLDLLSIAHSNFRISGRNPHPLGSPSHTPSVSYPTDMQTSISKSPGWETSDWWVLAFSALLLQALHVPLCWLDLDLPSWVGCSSLCSQSHFWTGSNLHNYMGYQILDSWPKLPLIGSPWSRPWMWSLGSSCEKDRCGLFTT